MLQEFSSSVPWRPVFCRRTFQRLSHQPGGTSTPSVMRFPIFGIQSRFGLALKPAEAASPSSRGNVLTSGAVRGHIGEDLGKWLCPSSKPNEKPCSPTPQVFPSGCIARKVTTSKILVSDFDSPLWGGGILPINMIRQLIASSCRTGHRHRVQERSSPPLDSGVAQRETRHEKVIASTRGSYRSERRRWPPFPMYRIRFAALTSCASDQQSICKFPVCPDSTCTTRSRQRIRHFLRIAELTPCRLVFFHAGFFNYRLGHS